MHVLSFFPPSRFSWSRLHMSVEWPTLNKHETNKQMRRLFWLLWLGKYRRGLGICSSSVTLAMSPIPFESKYARTAVISREVGARGVVMANMSSFFTLINICKRFGQGKTSWSANNNLTATRNWCLSLSLFPFPFITLTPSPFKAGPPLRLF